MFLNPWLLTDFYKLTHILQYRPELRELTSYLTPRGSRLKNINKIVMFGLSAYVHSYVVENFNKNFFNRPWWDTCNEVKEVLKEGLGYSDEMIFKTLENLHALYELGYLPVEINAVAEGTLVPMGVPCVEIKSTNPQFFWVGQALEASLSAAIWHPMISATIAREYRKIAREAFAKTVENGVDERTAMCDFSMRGQESKRSAYKSSAAWLLSFVNTATVPAIDFLERYYNCDCSKEEVGFGAVSTEHSVMCSNYAVDGDEETLLKRLLTEIYPDTSFSCVLDSYDYWNVIESILPKLKSEILAHNGCMLMRGDSGDCVEVITQTVFKLWDIFGGTINSTGYKVLDPHVKAIYGDSITIQRCEKIYAILAENGFACSNVALGVGSFSFQCVEEDGILKPFTRDTFSSCIKATYCEIDGKPYPIFKNPKDGGFKKSQKGCCIVVNDGNSLKYTDGYNWNDVTNEPSNLLKPVFRDSKMIKEQSLSEIRNILHGGNF